MQWPLARYDGTGSRRCRKSEDFHGAAEPVPSRAAELNAFERPVGRFEDVPVRDGGRQPAPRDVVTDRRRALEELGAARRGAVAHRGQPSTWRRKSARFQYAVTSRIFPSRTRPTSAPTIRKGRPVARAPGRSPVWTPVMT